MSLVVGKRLAAVVLSGAVLVGVAGCDASSLQSPPPASGVEGVYVSTVKLPDGRSMLCATRMGQGISCDWAGAK